jgi:hypothetical protein
MKLYSLLGFLLGLNYLTRYASIGILATFIVFFAFDYIRNRKIYFKGAVWMFSISFAIILIWILRNIYVAQSLEDGANPDSRIFRNIFYSVRNYWEIFLNIKKVGGFFMGTVILLLVPIFIYRFFKTFKYNSQLGDFYSFNYLFILIYTFCILIIRTFFDHVTLDSRMFSILIFPFSIILLEIKNNILRNLIILTIVILGLFQWNNLYKRDTDYCYIIFHSKTYSKAVSIINEKLIKTNDPTPFMMLNDKIEVSNDLNLRKNEVFVMFFNGYHFDKKLYLKASSLSNLKKEVFDDGAIFYLE